MLEGLSCGLSNLKYHGLPNLLPFPLPKPSGAGVDVWT